MPAIPTDEQIREELHKAMDEQPKLRCCANCTHYSLVTGFCEKINKTFPKIMYGCKHFITAEEMLIAKARENLIQQARDCEKVEFLLAMSLTAAGMTTMMVEDFERRVEAVFQMEKGKDKDNSRVKFLKMDLELGAQMRRAFKSISHSLESIDRQYRLYIQTHLDRLFKKEGIPYNEEGYSNYISDSGEFAMFLFEMARVAHHNRENMDKVYEYMRTLKNQAVEGDDVSFCLEDKDIQHYRLKGY